MSYKQNRSAVAQITLATAVADDGTLTVGYPSGFAQGDFVGGLADKAYVLLNDNDRLDEGDPGFGVSYGASNMTITNQSGASWPAGTKLTFGFDVKDGNDVVFITMPMKFAKIANGDMVVDAQYGIAGKVEHWWMTMTDPVTTAAKAANLKLNIDGVDVEGGALALTSAAATPIGKTVAAAAITGNNAMKPSSKLKVIASGVTTFSEGEGFLTLRVRKSDAYA